MSSTARRYRKTDRHHPLAALKTLLPCVPYNFYCAGLNYAAHSRGERVNK